MSDASFVCFRAGRCNLKDAAASLIARGITVIPGENELEVSFPGSPILRVAYASGSYVAQEAAEIATENRYAMAMLPCDARFEILIDDLDAVLDEINTLIDVQSTLEELAGGFVFNTWNGCFPGNASDG